MRAGGIRKQRDVAAELAVVHACAHALKLLEATLQMAAEAVVVRGGQLAMGCAAEHLERSALPQRGRHCPCPRHVGRAKGGAGALRAPCRCGAAARCPHVPEHAAETSTRRFHSGYHLSLGPFPPPAPAPAPAPAQQACSWSS